MPRLYILTSEKEEYRKSIEQANLPDLEFTDNLSEGEIVLGEPRMLREKLSQLPNLKWMQSMYAGVEALMDSSLRHDYTLTNARGVYTYLDIYWHMKRKSSNATRHNKIINMIASNQAGCAAKPLVCSA